MTTLYTGLFPKTILASMLSLCLSSSAFALQELSDDGLSQATGAGIALLPQDAYFVFRGADANEDISTILTDRTQDTGYIHYLPIGPLTSFSQDTNGDGSVNGDDHSVGKADLYLYGLALSKNVNNDSNSRLDAANPAIRSWGTAENPWLFKIATAKNVPNFEGESDEATYLNLEAPLYQTALPTESSLGADAYNLKLALWADAFVLDQSKTDSDSTRFNLGETHGSSDASRANRLRLQAIMNGFSINGSNLQLFQTLDGSSNTNGMSAFYNNTLGLSGIIRMNSGISDQVQASDAKVLRLSTQEMSDTDLFTSPALNGSSAPEFSSDEGIFIYNLNTNLVLGSLYQPLILGSDGKNFSLEIARIPDVPAIYQKIYTNYDDPNPKTNGGYLGSTCNVYQCGMPVIEGYQGGSPQTDYAAMNGTLPTHSSISIGTVTQGVNNTLQADKSANAVGVSFGKTGTTGSVNLGSAAIDGLLIQHMKITTTGL